MLGGLLTEYLGWRWVLLVNPPIIAVLVALMLRHLPAEPGRAQGARLDLPGAGAATASIAALIFAVTEGQQHGLAGARALIAFGVAVVLAAAFVAIERRSGDPMLPPALLRDPARRAALIVIFLLGAVFAGYVYFVALYLQRALGHSAVMTGLALVPATCTALVVSTQVARRALPAFGSRRVLFAALVLVGAGQLWLSRMTGGGSYAADVLGGMVLVAAGLGLAFPAASFAITADVAPHQRGVAGGMFVTAQEVGAAVGLAVLATLAAARTQRTGDLVGGYRLSYLVATGLVVVGMLVLALMRGSGRAPVSPPRASEHRGTETPGPVRV